MRSRMVVRVTAMAACLTFLLASVYTAGAAAAEDGPTVKDLAAAARKAKEHFRPLGPSDVETAKTALLDAIASSTTGLPPPARMASSGAAICGYRSCRRNSANRPGRT